MKVAGGSWEEFALPYRNDSLYWFERIRGLRAPALLASGPGGGGHAGNGHAGNGHAGNGHAGSGRFDIVCADPIALLTTDNGRTRIEERHTTGECGDDPFLLAQDLLLRYRPSAVPAADGFVGGLLGYFSYDLARTIERIPERSVRDIEIPEMSLGIYPWALVTDHLHRTTTLRISPLTGARERRELTRLLGGGDGCRESVAFRLEGPPRSNVSRAEYASALERILAYIGAGDCYQVNFTQRFSAPFSGDPLALYERLSHALPARFGAYLELPDCAILSRSPEQFLGVSGREVITRPIKGTRPRGRDHSEDRRLARELLASAKDRAENLMIVDLLRNDLGRTCLPGSIHVPELFRLYSIANVHHLVSTVTGTLSADRHPLELLRGCFPGGSITGAPKVRAMEIIEELEPARRSIYTGSIAYVGFDGAMDSNIAIRTLLCSRGEIHCWGGGGIVADSDAGAEYRESLDKIDLLLATMATGEVEEPRASNLD